jgi:hypothetical protein
MPEVPSALRMPVRAAVGLAATLVDETRRLPDRALELPMLAVSRALHFSLKAQQQYAAMAARGEQVLSGSKVTDEAPEWATFDDLPGGEAADMPGSTNGVVGSAATASRAARAGKTGSVRPPRGGAPSAFDIVTDPDADPETDDIVPDTD